jgi:putative heme-binding domain-containing protein
MTFRLLLSLLFISAAQARVPWTTSRIQGSPEPAKPFIAEEILMQHSFTEALEIVGLPEQIVVIENAGKIWSLTTDLSSTQKDLVIDLKASHAKLDHVYGIAFHPNWRENGAVFITYTVGSGIEDGTKLSRFKLSSTQPLTLDPASEVELLSWLSGGHNGAHLQFGPDGMLYISAGDAEVPSPPDPRNTGQDTSDFLSSILRIDVDRKADAKNYAVPADNPFLGKPNVRPEIWAFGFRNPWKISFDAKGRLWCGDVGWELWEMIHLVDRGSNHGWSAMEATQSVKPQLLSPLAPIKPPVIAHPHTEAASITGGYVYHGKAFPELDGAYVYGDYETGKIWALWHDGSRITRHEEIADTPHKIVTFGQLADGEIIYAHWGKPSSFHRLTRNPAIGNTAHFPRKLSETGLFQDTAKQTPADGVYAFSVAEPMWQDRLLGTRFIALPGSATIQASIQKRKDGSRSGEKVIWPKDAVLVKTLSTPESPARLVETQILHNDGETWTGYSYRWNAAQTDADLVTANGAEATMPLQAAEPIQHRFHARAECIRCHTPWTGFALGFQPQQLTSIAGKSARESAIELGLVNEAFFELSAARLVSSHDEKADLEARARSWLHANCAHCHRKNGGGSVALKVNIDLPLLETELIGEKPLRGDMGIPEARLIAPGLPAHSALLARIGRTGSGRMPIIGSQEVDQHAFELLWAWIDDLSKRQPALLEKHPLPPEIKAASIPAEAPIDTVPKALTLLSQQSRHTQEQHTLLTKSLTTSDPNLAPLFERFLPPEQRRKTLGLMPDEAQLLSLTGDPKRGADILSPTGRAATCLACHIVKGTGRDFGPDLSQVGTRLTREQLLESLLHPSKLIAPGYSAYTATLKDGTQQMGFLLKKSQDEVTLKLATGQSLTLPTAETASLTALPTSLMPEGLLQSFTAQEVADLLSYLAGLR